MTRESQNRAATRTRILDAAELLLETRSAQAFKVADIAVAAGVSPSLVIQYFNSKDELVFEACLRRMHRLYPDLYASAPEEYWGFLAFCFKRDLEFSHIITDLLSLSWRWSDADEQRVIEAGGPRLAALRAALDRSGAKLSAEERDVAVALTTDLYFAVLRRACVKGLNATEALAELRPALSAALPFIKGAR